MDENYTFKDLKDYHKNFTRERKWEDYHDPKSVAMSIAIEAAELMEIFQWKSIKESYEIDNNEAEFTHVKEELSDVIMYCASLANVLDIDISEAILDKIKKNEIKYPKESNKYTDKVKEDGSIEGR